MSMDLEERVVRAYALGYQRGVEHALNGAAAEVPSDWQGFPPDDNPGDEDLPVPA